MAALLSLEKKIKIENFQIFMMEFYYKNFQNIEAVYEMNTLWLKFERSFIKID